VFAAMSKEFGGSYYGEGTWYTCPNGHAYVVGKTMLSIDGVIGIDIAQSPLHTDSHPWDR